MRATQLRFSFIFKLYLFAFPIKGKVYTAKESLLPTIIG